MESRERQTAYKIWIKDIVNNKLIKQEGEWDPSYIIVNDKKISRVNILATVVFKYKTEDGNYCSITIDDGSDTIRLKAWREDSKLLEDIDVGNMVLIVGRVREYNEEIYIIPETIKIVNNPNWELVRKIELIKNFGCPTKNLEEKEIKEEAKITQIPKEQQLEEEVVEDDQKQSTTNIRQKILNTIEKLDVEEGVDKGTLLNNLGSEQEKTNFAILELLKEGEIYEFEPGKLKITK